MTEAGHLLPAVLLLYAILIPQEVRVEVSGVTLYAYRLVCFALLPWIAARVFRGALRMHPIDAVIAIGGTWMVLSFVMVSGDLQGFVSGAGLAIDVLVPYFVARVTIHNVADMRKLLIIYAPGIFAAGVIIMVEAVTHQPIIKPLVRSIFSARAGFVESSSGSAEIRLGLRRSEGPFAHPILAGLILASAGCLFATSGLRKWPMWLGVSCMLLSVFTVSSAAFLAILLGVGLIGYDKVSRFFTFLGWPIFMVGAAIGMLFIQFASDNGLIRFLLRFTLNPQTGYYRRLIWQYGTENVAANPLFGIAFAEYERLSWMNASVDAYWLADAIRHGLIVPLCFLVATLWALFALGRQSAAATSETDRHFMIGVAITLVVLVVIGFTVSFFGGVLLWFYIVLGVAVSLLKARAVPWDKHTRVT
ncbi:hypothetical protein D2V07_17105 [Aurantiacibacter zhengii]|uniref:O-antigen ligase domain-containing protein n=1 Tax=Aurantiacibacter zhengii TaxID=2307003 RepID=A0A418NN79_9SPHN|nr:hypothetical protein D2V07_17105 [Aurantiacibacter zhengii]